MPVKRNLLILSFLDYTDFRTYVENLNKLKYECCQNSKLENSIVMCVDADKENCERYRQDDRENQQYNKSFQFVHAYND